MRWIYLEPIEQSEVSQKNKYHILIHIIYIYIYMESKKMVLMDLFAGQQWRCGHRELTCGLREGRERVGQMEKVARKHIRYHM